MTTLKDKIRDAVMEYHNEKDVAPDPEVLVEAVMEEIKEYFNRITE
jgi:hypothetical protein